MAQRTNFFNFLVKHPAKTAASFLLAFILCAAGNTCTAQPSVSEKRQQFIDYALTLRGIPYVYAGHTEKGFDCSGFVSYAAKKGINENLPRSSGDMWAKIEHIKPSEREPGDLIFFAVKNSKGYFVISHVGIYLGMYHGEGELDGKRLFVHAASAGPKTGVIVTPVDDRYWSARIYGYGRFLEKSVQEEAAPEIKEGALKEDESTE